MSLSLEVVDLLNALNCEFKMDLFLAETERAAASNRPIDARFLSFVMAANDCDDLSQRTV